MPRVEVTHYTDPGCPWAWSAAPALTALMWRFGDQLTWRHVMIGLSEDPDSYAARGFTPLRFARGYAEFRRFGMPFAVLPKARLSATSPACRAIVAVRLQAPEREWAALRALQYAQFCGGGLLDDPDVIRAALARVEGIDVEAVLASLDDPEVWEAYDEDRAAARTAAGTPAEVQGKTAVDGEAVRFTAPSLVFACDGRTLTAGGFQSPMAYDVLLANLAPDLERQGAPADLREALAAFPDGLTTRELAELSAEGPALEVDVAATEDALLELVAGGAAAREPLGDDALWLPSSATRAQRAADGRFAHA